MKPGPVIARDLAKRDVEAAIEHYLREGAEKAALEFIEALEQAYVHIGSHPAAGSARYAHELNLPRLRCGRCRATPTSCSSSSAAISSTSGACCTAGATSRR